MEEKKWVDAIDEYYKMNIYAATDIRTNSLCQRLIKSLDIIDDQIVLNFSKVNITKSDLLLSVSTVSYDYKGYMFYYTDNSDYHYIKITKIREESLKFPAKLPTASEVITDMSKKNNLSLDKDIDEDCNAIINEFISSSDPVKPVRRLYADSMIGKLLMSGTYAKLVGLGYKVVVDTDLSGRMRVLEVSLIQYEVSSIRRSKITIIY